MINKTFFKMMVGGSIALASLSSCVQKDEWETPPIHCENKWEAPTSTIAQIIAMAPNTGSYQIPNGENDPEIIIDGYVISSDENGNFYKTISFQDSPQNPTAGLQIELDKTSNYADLPVGAHIRIRVNGLVIGLDRGSYKLGAVDPQYAIGRIPQVLEARYISGVCDGNKMDIQTIIPTQLNSLNEAKQAKYINTLVTVSNVMFGEDALGKTFVDYDNGTAKDTDRNLIDLIGNNAVLRNSAYFTDGKTTVPSGMGNITFVVGRYNTNYQMQIRSIKDIEFLKDRPQYLFKETFDTPLATNWEPVSVSGAQVWNIDARYGNPKPVAVMSGFANGANYENEDWLISKPIAIDGAYTSVNLLFDTNARFAGNPLEAYITDNYTGDPTTTQWTKLNAQMDTDLSTFQPIWQSSGILSLNAYIGKSVRIAFKYTSTTAAASTWQIDNISISGVK